MAKAKPSESVAKRGGTGKELIADEKFANFVRSTAARQAGEHGEAVKKLTDEDVYAVAEHVLSKQPASNSETPNVEDGEPAAAGFSSFLTESYTSVQSFILNLPPEVKQQIARSLLEFAGLI